MLTYKYIEKLLDLYFKGELSQEEKDAFFEAVMRAYVTSKDIASVKFGRKK